MKYFAISHSDSCNKYYIYIYIQCTYTHILIPTVSDHSTACHCMYSIHVQSGIIAIYLQIHGYPGDILHLLLLLHNIIAI